jgi:hypothetical protein
VEFLNHKNEEQMSNKTLHLNLKKQWFDMILSGVKKCEYRDMKEYWSERLFPAEDFTTVTFSNGYSKDRRQFEIELQDITTGEGREDWGAVKGKQYYILCLGGIMSTTRCDLKIPSCDVLSQRSDNVAASPDADNDYSGKSPKYSDMTHSHKLGYFR